MMPTFKRGDTAIIQGSFEAVTVVAQFGDIVLVKRAGGQMPYSVEKLEPYCPGVCPLQP